MFFCLIMLGIGTISCKGDRPKGPTVIETEKAVDEGWVSIFDGESFEGWKIYLKDSIPEEWQIEGGALVFRPNPERDPGMNNLITEKQKNRLGRPAKVLGEKIHEKIFSLANGLIFGYVN